MRTALRALWVSAFLLGSGCNAPDGPSRPQVQTPRTGAEIYGQPLPNGNTFACETCHALSEPTSDGLRRPAHPIGDAANRTSFKNGELTSLFDAVNTCVVEWMRAPALRETEATWRTLEAFLREQAEGAPLPAASVEIQVAVPPTDLAGGAPNRGREVFHETCVLCHGANGNGTERGPALRGSRVDAPLIARRVRTSGLEDSAVYAGLSGGVMPFWGADRLSDPELLDVIAYVADIAEDVVVDADAGVAFVDAGGDAPCGSTHPSVGRVAELETHFHDVSGEVRVVDDCTLEVTMFNFDGQGIDARFYAGRGDDFTNGFAFGMDLVRGTPYVNERFDLRIPEGHTLDDFDAISVWCIPARISFGDGRFE